MTHGISRVAAGIWGIFSSYSGDGRSKLHWVQRCQDSTLVRTDTSGTKLGLAGYTDASGGEVGDHSPLSSFHRDIGMPINFKKVSGLGPFQNSELSGPLEVSRDVRPPVQMRWDIGFSLGNA